MMEDGDGGNLGRGLWNYVSLWILVQWASSSQVNREPQDLNGLASIGVEIANPKSVAVVPINIRPEPAALQPWDCHRAAFSPRRQCPGSCHMGCFPGAGPHQVLGLQVIARLGPPGSTSQSLRVDQSPRKRAPRPEPTQHLLGVRPSQESRQRRRSTPMMEMNITESIHGNCDGPTRTIHAGLAGPGLGQALRWRRAPAWDHWPGRTPRKGGLPERQLKPRQALDPARGAAVASLSRRSPPCPKIRGVRSRCIDFVSAQYTVSGEGLPFSCDDGNFNCNYHWRLVSWGRLLIVLGLARWELDEGTTFSACWMVG